VYTHRKRGLTLTGKKSGIGRGKAQLFAVDKFGVVDYVLEKYGDNVPATKISAMLLSEKEIKISPVGINRWLTKHKQQSISDTSIMNKEKFDVMVIDYKNEITAILDEVKEMKSLAKEKGELDIYVKLVSKLFQGLELLAKLMGDIKPSGSVDINVIIKEINQNVFEKNKGGRHKLFDTEIVDAEFEILKDDEIEKDKINEEPK